jgi:hypothetical protein
LLGLLPAVYCAPPGAAPEAGALPDPLPLRRLLISPERIPLELRRARQDALVQMPREEFEARVAEAARAALATQSPPRLVEARYRVSLVDTALVGTAQWTVINPAVVPGILPLQPLNFALRQILVDNRDAVLGDLDGKSLALLVDRPGQHTVSAGWSARGDPSPGGLRFEVKVPSCVLTTLELELPADRTATLLGDNGLLSGPQPSSDPHQRTWRLLGGSSPSIDLLIRPTSAANATQPLILARLRTEQRLKPHLVEADYDFNLEVLHGAIRELWCEGDPVLRPTAVSVGNTEIETWELRPGRTPESPFSLRIQLAERFQGDLFSVRVRCLAPVDSTKRWTSPALRLKGAVSQGETLSLHLSPDVQLDDWQPGSFGLTRATAESNGGQALSLEAGSGAAPKSSAADSVEQGTRGAETSAHIAPHSGLDASRPSARLQSREPDYRARELAWWHIAADNASLNVQIDYEIARGRLFRIPVSLPANWTLERVDLSPSDLLRNWITMPGEHDQSIVIVELQRPLESSAHCRIDLQLRPANTGPVGSPGNRANAPESFLSFPEIVPQGTRSWDGALAIRIDPVYEATVHASSAAVIPEKGLELKGSTTQRADEPRYAILDPLAGVLDSYQSPWGTQQPDYLYSFRGQAVRGTLMLRSRSPRVRARCTSEIALASGRAAVFTRLLLQPDVGNPDTIDLLVSAPVVGPWNWRSEGGRNAVKGMQRLTAAEVLPHLFALCASTPLSALNLLYPQLSRVTWWRLTLAQPLREPLLLETTFDLVRAGLSTGPASRLSPLAGSTLLESLALAAASSESRTESQGGRWEVPLLVVVPAQPMDGEVRLYLAAAGIDRIEPIGLGEIATVSAAGDTTPWRTFRYSRLPVSLVLHGRTAMPDRRMTAWIERARLTTYVQPAGQLLNYYSFQVRNWKQGTLPLRLPPGAQLLAAKVEGRWLAHPRLAEMAAGTAVAQLPVATDSPTQLVEVVYALAYPLGTLWSQVKAPVPVLPVGTVAFRRTWCLPDSIMPLSEGMFERHPGQNWDFDGSFREAMSLPFLAEPSASFVSDDWRHRQERQLIEALTHLLARPPDNERRTLGEMLHYLTYDFLKGQENLVIDAVALREASLRPATPIPENVLYRKGELTASAREGSIPFVEAFGLIWMPCRPAPFLTTRRQGAALQGALSRNGSVSDSVETAVSEAVAHGHDRSGRFRSAADWLRDSGADWDSPHEHESGAEIGEAVLPGAPTFLPHPESWTEWQPLAGLPDEETIVVLRQNTLWGLAYSTGGMLFLAWWWVQRQRKRLGYGLTLCWLAASVFGFLWLPTALRTVFWWPMLAGIALAVTWYLASAIRYRSAAPPPEPRAVAVVLLLAFVAGLQGQAGPSPYTVWLLPGAKETPEQLQALVPPELLTELRALARRGAAGLQGAILVSAKYEGTVAGSVADLQADFQVHCFSDEPTTLRLPLDGVGLREAVWDGSTAYPEALARPQNGYSLKVQGRGNHTLRLRFSVRIQPSAGDDQDLRFTIPELVRSQLTLVVPEGARYLQAVVGRGAQRVIPDPTGVRLEADLGRVATVHVHWRHESPRPSSATAEVKEVYYWDVQRSGSRLVGLLNYTVTSGAVNELTARLPDEMEVRQVELISPTTGALWPRLKDWTVFGAGGERRLRLVLQAPVTSNVQLLLELVPRLPLAHGAVLPLPTPLGVSFGDGLLAFRVKGLQSSVADSRGVMSIEPADFEPHWQPAGTEYPGLPERAYRFHRASGTAPFLRLDLRPPAPRRECVQDLTWHLSPERADLHATAKIAAPQRDLAFVEWEIPAEIVVADVRGADVRSWFRKAARLQVWLQRSVAESTLELTGWIDGRGADWKSTVLARADWKSTPPAEKLLTSFQLPCLAFPGAASHFTFVRLITDKDWTLDAGQLSNLSPLPDTRAVDNDRNYLSNQPVYDGIFQLHPGIPHADLQILSLVEVRDRRIAFSATIDYDLGQRKSRTLTVRLRNWKGQEPRLEAPATISRSQPRRDPLARTWTLKLPPATPEQIQCQLTGILAADSNAEMIMPEVSVDEAASSERWLAAVGQGLRPEEQRGLVPTADAASFQSRWPEAALRLRQRSGSIWRIDASDWKLRLRTDFPLVESKPAQLLFDEQAAAIVDGRRWLHQATYWLYQESGTHLGVLLPDGAALMMATLDGSEVTPLQAGSELWLPLPGGSGMRLLRLRWIFYADHEQLDSPCLNKPRLENVTPLPVEQRLPTLWTVHIPPGYRLAHAGENTVPSNRIERSLLRATAELLLTGLLAQHAAGKADDSPSRQLLTAQEDFYKHCRDVDYELAFPERPKEGAGSLENMSIRLQRLEADNKQLAQAQYFETIRRQAEEKAASQSQKETVLGGIGPEYSTAAASDELLAEQGTPTYWQIRDVGGAPPMRITPVLAEQTRRALAYSAIFLVVMGAACILPFYPRTVAWLWAAWPEQIIVIAGLGWLLRGESVAVALLVFLGLAARLIYLGRWFVILLRRPAPAARNEPASSS